MSLVDLPDAMEWLRDHYEAERPVPVRLHNRETDPQGQLGTPRMTGAFLGYLTARPSDLLPDQSETVACTDIRHDCLMCQGDGVYTVSRARYRYPMWRALTLLGRRGPIRAGHPSPFNIAVTIAECGYDARTAAVVLDQPWERFEALALMALRTLHGIYAAGPTPRRSWVDLSESQQNAEGAA